ncbi:MAG: hypothetical protein V4543_08975 [Bacteroidota bacterium]
MSVYRSSLKLTGKSAGQQPSFIKLFNKACLLLLLIFSPGLRANAQEFAKATAMPENKAFSGSQTALPVDNPVQETSENEGYKKEPSANKVVNSDFAGSQIAKSRLKMKRPWLKAKGANYVDEDFIKTEGLTGILELGLLTGLGSYTLDRKVDNVYSAWTYHAQIAYMFHGQFAAGIGSGLEHFGSFRNVPLFANGRYCFHEGKASAFVDVSAGLAFALDSSSYGGEFIEGCAGGKIYTSNTISIHMSAGYRLQDVFFRRITDKDGIRRNYEDYATLNFLHFKIGMSF